MSVVDIMRELHRLRKHARDLREQIERAPRTLDIQRAKVAREEKAVVEARESLKKLKAGIMDKELTLKSTHQEMVKKKAYLNAASSTKEYQALDHEIKNAVSLCSRLEEEILNAMAEVEERTAKLPELEKAVQKTKDDLTQLERTSGERLASHKEQLEQAMAKVKEVEATLPEEVRLTYIRMSNARDDEALSAVQARNCTACATSITGQMYNDLLSGRLVLCKSCGRILYLPE